MLVYCLCLAAMRKEQSMHKLSALRLACPQRSKRRSVQEVDGCSTPPLEEYPIKDQVCGHPGFSDFAGDACMLMCVQWVHARTHCTNPPEPKQPILKIDSLSGFNPADMMKSLVTILPPFSRGSVPHVGRLCIASSWIVEYLKAA